MMDEKAESYFQKAIAMVKCIPHGEVTSYGQIAILISGTIRGARAVGYALAALTEEEAKIVPWWRVVNAQGRISASHAHMGAIRQRALLEAEGVTFNEEGRIDFSKYGWDGPEGYF
jgi:methylated-DNA-protein-cysteine methyltransferase-like protein